MMAVLIGIALKSLLIAGLSLGLLKLMTNRSAAERSWVAHVGLFALLIMAFAPLMLPGWNVEAPALLGQTAQPVMAAKTADLGSTARANPGSIVPAGLTIAKPAQAQSLISPGAAATALYAVPAAMLLLITLLALARLMVLRTRAEVLVDGHWLGALARAQRRMGFKHGTALLTSDDLASPISWGLMRPVILLNSRAVEATGEAEAIIAHELAHVARMDWIKLLLARVATALFWFNPLVWILAREAHQLREEAADDSVLGADIVDTDYAQLLVGVARHECPGLLLGAHGVAPSRSSLARRVARVLDGKSVRGPAPRSFTLGIFVGAVLIAAPLAALTLTPGVPREAKTALRTPALSERVAFERSDAADVPADLPHIIAHGVSTSVATAVAAVAPTQTGSATTAHRSDRDGAHNWNVDIPRVEVRPDVRWRPDIQVRPDVQLALKNLPVAFNDESKAIDRAAELKAVGVSAEYAAAIRRAMPQVRLADHEIVELAALRVTPAYISGLAAAGFIPSTAGEIAQAQSVGVSCDYAREIAAAGYSRVPISQLIEMKTVGITPRDVARFRRPGRGLPSVETMVKMKALGLTPDDLEPNDTR